MTGLMIDLDMKRKLIARWRPNTAWGWRSDGEKRTDGRQSGGAETLLRPGDAQTLRRPGDGQNLPAGRPHAQTRAEREIKTEGEREREKGGAGGTGGEK